MKSLLCHELAKYNSLNGTKSVPPAFIRRKGLKPATGDGNSGAQEHSEKIESYSNVARPVRSGTRG